MENTISAALPLLRQACHVTVLTGAGVSAESGVPTFRDVLTGLWARYEAEDLATAAAFERDPALVWGWYEWRRSLVLRVQPNPAHRAIAAMAARVKLSVVTQNVDDLHERAGSTGVIHVHGSLHTPRCFACATPWHYPAGIPDEPEGGRRLAPPPCPRCGEPIRPGVVWFGESLPTAAWQAAQQAVRDCDVLLSVGTSSLVYPAAQLPFDAAREGKTVIQINPSATHVDAVAQLSIAGKAGEVLPHLLGAWA